MKSSSHVEEIALETASRMPDALAMAERHDGHISLVLMLRHCGIPYGIGQRIIDTLLDMHMVEPCGAPDHGYRLVGGAL